MGAQDHVYSVELTLLCLLCVLIGVVAQYLASLLLRGWPNSWSTGRQTKPENKVAHNADKIIKACSDADMLLTTTQMGFLRKGVISDGIGSFSMACENGKAMVSTNGFKGRNIVFVDITDCSVSLLDGKMTFRFGTHTATESGQSAQVLYMLISSALGIAL